MMQPSALDKLAYGFPAIASAAFPVVVEPSRMTVALEELARRAPLLAGRCVGCGAAACRWPPM